MPPFSRSYLLITSQKDYFNAKHSIESILDNYDGYKKDEILACHWMFFLPIEKMMFLLEELEKMKLGFGHGLYSQNLISSEDLSTIYDLIIELGIICPQ